MALGRTPVLAGGLACAALVLVAVVPTAFRPSRTTRVYGTYGPVPVATPGPLRFARAPAPERDPFCKPNLVTRPPDLLDGALREPEEEHTRTFRRKPVRRGREGAGPSGQGWAVDRLAIDEARKRAVWHPHPDDELPAWKMW